MFAVVFERRGSIELSGCPRSEGSGRGASWIPDWGGGGSSVDARKAAQAFEGHRGEAPAGYERTTSSGRATTGMIRACRTGLRRANSRGALPAVAESGASDEDRHTGGGTRAEPRGHTRPRARARERERQLPEHHPRGRPAAGVETDCERAPRGHRESFSKNRAKAKIRPSSAGLLPGPGGTHGGEYNSTDSPILRAPDFIQKRRPETSLHASPIDSGQRHMPTPRGVTRERRARSRPAAMLRYHGSLTPGIADRPTDGRQSAEFKGSRVRKPVLQESKQVETRTFRWALESRTETTSRKSASPVAIRKTGNQRSPPAGRLVLSQPRSVLESPRVNRSKSGASPVMPPAIAVAWT